MLDLIDENRTGRVAVRDVCETCSEPGITGLLRRLCRLSCADESIALLSERHGGSEYFGGSSRRDAADLEELARDVAASCSEARRNDADVFIARFTSEVAAGGVLAIRVALDVRTVLTVAALRFTAAHEFNLNDERGVRRVADWIGDHLKLWWQLRVHRRRGAGIHAALDLAGEAVLVLDRNARLLNANSTARLLLEAGDGLRASGETLTAVNLDDSVRLHAAITHVASFGSSTADLQHAPVVLVRRKGRRPLSIAVTRAAGNAGNDIAIVLLAADPETDLDAMLAPACSLYGLTATEARLVRLLVGGANLAEAAAAMRVQEPTARSYLKQVFVKAGVNRQASLVRLMLTSLIRTGPGVVLKPL